MHPLGHTRSARAADHLLQTPDTFVRAPLPGMRAATAIVHAAPAIGAKFTQYTAEFDPAGALGDPIGQRFVYVLEGELDIDGSTLAAGDYAYRPNTVIAKTKARAAVIEKPYIGNGALPAAFTGRESTIPGSPLAGDDALTIRELIPSDPTFDFAVNTMTFQPGASLAMIEIHVMEHGLLMLEGGGIYRLSDRWHPVAAGDFIWMAPYCPQWFGAIGKTPARYLIYKDWNRHPLAT